MDAVDLPIWYSVLSTKLAADCIVCVAARVAKLPAVVLNLVTASALPSLSNLLAKSQTLPNIFVVL